MILPLLKAEIVPILTFYSTSSLYLSHQIHPIVLQCLTPLDQHRFPTIFFFAYFKINKIETKMGYCIQTNFPKINRARDVMYNMIKIVSIAL